MKFYKYLMLAVLVGCQSDSKELPILSYRIDSGHTVNYTITYDNFLNQSNESFSTKNIKGKVFIANFFFTSCPSICPPMRTELIVVANTFKSEKNFMIISHTIDPNNDSVAVLKDYSESTEIPKETWQFLRASLDHTKEQAKQYMTNFKPNDAETDFYHSSYVALVDKKQQIRGFYNILITEEVKRLIEDIKFLL